MPVSGFTTWTFADYDGEKSSIEIRTLAIDGDTYDPLASRRSDVSAALAGISLCQIQAVKFGNNDLQTLALPTDQAAQRELKWLIHYTDKTSKKRYSITVPGADVALLDPDRRGFADMHNINVILFVSAFELLMLSPTGGDIDVTDIELVGRAV